MHDVLNEEPLLASACAMALTVAQQTADPERSHSTESAMFDNLTAVALLRQTSGFTVPGHDDLTARLLHRVNNAVRALIGGGWPTHAAGDAPARFKAARALVIHFQETAVEARLAALREAQTATMSRLLEVGQMQDLGERRANIFRLVERVGADCRRVERAIAEIHDAAAQQ